MKSKIKTAVYGAVIVIVVFAGGFFSGRQSAPEQITTVTQIEVVEVEKIVERIVERVVEKKAEETQKKQQIHIVETIHPDGTIVKETFIVNEDTIIVYQEKETDKDSSKETDKETSTSKTETKIVTHTVKPEWRVGGVALVKTQAKGADLSDYMVYGVNVEKRMFWNIYGGVMATTEKDVGLSLSITF